MEATGSKQGAPATAAAVPPAATARTGVVRVASVAAIASLSITILLQLVMAPLLLSNWRDAGYAFFVAVQGFSGYVSVADAGIQIYLSQKLATLRARGDVDAADTLTKVGLRAFVLLASAGCAIVFLAFLATGHRVWVGLARACGVSPSMALTAAFAQIGAGAMSMALGGWSTAVDCGHGRYLRVQVFGIVRSVLLLLGISLFAAGGMGPSSAILLVSLAQIAFELTRFTLAYRAEHWTNPASDVGIPWHILSEARGSVVLSFSTTTQNGLQAYVAAALSSTAVSVAMPGKTIANGARTVSNAIANVVWVPVAARFAELENGSARYKFWSRNAPIMSTVQLAGVALLLALAPLVVPHWLPHKSDAILRLLPFYCVEQGAYAAALPTIILAQALGKFGMLGAVTAVSAVVSVTATFVAVPTYGAVGFASANSMAAALVMVPALLVWEWSYWRAMGVRSGATLAVRGLIVFIVTGIALTYTRAPGLGVGVLFALVLASAWGVHVRRRAPEAGRGDVSD